MKPSHSGGRQRHHASAPAATSSATARDPRAEPLGTTPSEPAIHTSQVASSSPSGLAKATPRPGRRANATAASGVAASPSTSISTKKRSAAVIPCGKTLMSRPDGHLRTHRRPAPDDRRLRAGSARAPDHPEFERAHHHLPPAGRRRGGPRRGRHLRPRRPARASRRAAPTSPLAGTWTFDDFSEHVGGLDLFRGRGAAACRPSRFYRRWAIESAALDLALRQAGRSLAQALGREARPLHFVVSLRIGSPPSFDPVADRLEAYPWLQFKLDATPDWDQDADRPAGGHRRGRLDRLQGRLQGHGRRRRDRPGLLPPHRRGASRTPGSRTPT